MRKKKADLPETKEFFDGFEPFVSEKDALVKKWGKVLEKNTDPQPKTILIEPFAPGQPLIEKPIKAKKVKTQLEENYYVSPKLFRSQIQTYYDTDKMNDELAMNLVKIAEGLSYKYNFINYTKTWKDEMIGDAIVKMYSALESKKFRIESEFSPFAYFNQIAWNAFSNRIKKEKKQHDGLEEYKQYCYEDAMNDPTSQGHVYVKPMLDSDENDGGYDD